MVPEYIFLAAGCGGGGGSDLRNAGDLPAVGCGNRQTHLGGSDTGGLFTGPECDPPGAVPEVPQEISVDA